ncbi:Beta propeller domain protein [Candidatus Burarchaeum australiense]|nr:Beta propeller domain protein [Candidatus Burarchaeum australiense]
MTQSKILETLGVAVIIFIMLFSAGCANPQGPVIQNGTGPTGGTGSNVSGTHGYGFVQATGQADVEKAFLQSSMSGYNYGGVSAGGIRTTAEGTGAVQGPTGAPAPTVPGASDSSKSTSDYSLTNVQVAGIDELDIVKTDSATGQRIYALDGNVVNFVDAQPADAMKRYATADTQWSNGIYEYRDVVVAISYNKVEAFYKDDGSEAWHANLNASYVDSRMANGIIYLVLSEYPQMPYQPRPMEVCGGKCMPVSIDYSRIYIPTGISSQVFYDVISLDAKTGDVLDSQAFTGPYSTTLYMSPDNIYVAMLQTNSQDTAMFNYLLDGGKGLVPTAVYNKLTYLNGLDISEQAKTVEFSIIIQNWATGLQPEESANFFNELQSGFKAYVKKNPEQLEYTGIAKLGYSEHGILTMKANGKVPGHLLNQFAMDEYDGNLRAAVTYGTWDDSENGVIVLGSDMAEKGRVVGLGAGERIYAVRFLGDEGYVVTYRQTDPLFVMDLSDPANPRVAGELKVPGFSTYLHPLGNGVLFGIGQDAQNVKVSLFDISNPAKPKELDTYIVNEYWSEALYNHHAFLYYSAKDLVILPIGGKDYVFSVAGNSISLKKIINEQNAQRNLYIGEDLYVMTGDEIVAYSFGDYQELKRVKLEGGYGPVYYGDVIPPIPAVTPTASGGSSAGSAGSAPSSTR